MNQNQLLQESTQCEYHEGRKDEQLNLICHELRTPLTAIVGNLLIAQLRLRHYAEMPEEDFSAVMQDISTLLARSLQQAQVQNRLIADLRDASSSHANMFRITFKRCDLGMLIHETVENQRAMAPDRTFSLELPPEQPLYVMADRDRIGQVLSNYLTNAHKYSVADQPVTVGISLEEHEVRVWVRDQGPGLSIEAQQRIWQRYYREPGIHIQNDSEVGLGLGLYICQTLIERHGGRVGVESREGMGATFWFTLPRAE
jgi:signal transduction histidine kinase